VVPASRGDAFEASPPRIVIRAFAAGLFPQANDDQLVRIWFPLPFQVAPLVECSTSRLEGPGLTGLAFGTSVHRAFVVGTPCPHGDAVPTASKLHHEIITASPQERGNRHLHDVIRSSENLMDCAAFSKTILRAGVQIGSSVPKKSLGQRRQFIEY
jgi:hypothetical protein